jgi:hypothetical protein
LRNYFKARWIKGDVFDTNPTYVETVYAPNCFGYDGNAQMDAFQSNLAPGWTIQRSDPGSTFVLVSPAWILTYLVVSGNNALVLNSFVWDSMKASEIGLIGNESPRESLYGYKSEGGGGLSSKTSSGRSGTLRITLHSYLLLLLNTWQTGVNGVVPQRWIEWLTLLINHYTRYTPAQIYGFLARVNFADATFKV